MVKGLLTLAFLVKASASADVLLAEATAIISAVNSNASASWRAGRNEVVFGRFHRLLGTDLDRDHASVPDRTSQGATLIPPEFDARKAWPDCSVIAAVRNQGECGSCWAFAAIEAFEDRWCIATGQDILMSPENLISCDDSAHSIDPSDGCEGGTLLSAWMFLENTGAVSESCQPYDLPTCPPEEQPCMDFKPTPPCREQCYGSGTLQRYQATSLTQPKGIEHTQQEIMTNGPIEVAFTVYDDFEHYKSGVYHHVAGAKAGGHAVKLIGWGEEGGVPYWLATNSWTEKWGDNGLFKIKRGTNECGIESPGLAAQAKYPQILASCTGSADPVISGPTCFRGKGGALGVTETVTVKVKNFASGKGELDFSGDGVTALSCTSKTFTKNGQDIMLEDCSDCLPKEVEITALKYCSDSDSMKLTIKDTAVPAPVSAILSKITCPAEELVV